MIEILPKKSVGPFVFNTPIASYLRRYPPDKIWQRDTTTNQVRYDFFFGDMSVYAENELVYLVSLKFDCYLKNINIFNLNIDKFFYFFQIDEKEQIVNDRIWVSNDEQQDVYEIDSLGLQLWVNNFDKIVAVIASDDVLNG